MDLTPICGGFVLCVVLALIVTAVLRRAPVSDSIKVHQAKTAPFVYYPSEGVQPYGMGAVDEDPYGRNNPIPKLPEPDSRSLSMQDVKFRIPDAVMNSTEPPKWAEAGKTMMLPEEMQPWDVGITNVQIITPKHDGRPPLTKDQL